MELSKHAYAAFAVQIHNCSAFETFQVFCFLFERQKLLWKRPRCIENEIENLQYFVCVCCQFGRLKPLLRDCHTNIFIYRNAECAARCFGPVKSLIFFFWYITWLFGAIVRAILLRRTENIRFFFLLRIENTRSTNPPPSRHIYFFIKTVWHTKIYRWDYWGGRKIKICNNRVVAFAVNRKSKYSDYALPIRITVAKETREIINENYCRVHLNCMGN